jgi:hypothetical protein
MENAIFVRADLSPRKTIYYRARNMNDDEARYLIDQYNKYASWGPRPFEVLLPYVAVALALMALFSPAVSPQESAVRTLLYGVPILTIVVLTIVFIVGRYGRYKDQLVLLERFRSKYKSLPDSVTLDVLLKHNAKKLTDLLDEAERHIGQTGHL